jgi:hypothetical protein
LHVGFLDRQPRVVAHWIPAFAGMTKLLLKLTLMLFTADAASRVRFKVMRGKLAIRESREIQRMATAKMSDEALLAFLVGHPQLRDRVASIVSAVENSEGDLKGADAAEERLFEEMRLFGREAMQGWANKQVEATEREIRRQPRMHRQGKKNSAGIRNSAKSRS